MRFSCWANSEKCLKFGKWFIGTAVTLFPQIFCTVFDPIWDYGLAGVNGEQDCFLSTYQSYGKPTEIESQFRLVRHLFYGRVATIEIWFLSRRRMLIWLSETVSLQD